MGLVLIEAIFRNFLRIFNIKMVILIDCKQNTGNQFRLWMNRNPVSYVLLKVCFQYVVKSNALRVLSAV